MVEMHVFHISSIHIRILNIHQVGWGDNSTSCLSESTIHSFFQLDMFKYVRGYNTGIEIAISMMARPVLKHK